MPSTRTSRLSQYRMWLQGIQKQNEANVINVDMTVNLDSTFTLNDQSGVVNIDAEFITDDQIRQLLKEINARRTDHD